MLKYRPQTAKVRSWDEIEEYYLNLDKHGWGVEKLVDLIRHIKSSNLKDRLFAYTSMGKLVISIYDPVEWNKEALHIEFDRLNQQIHFIYHSRPNERPTFERRYDADLGIQKFDKFVEMIKW